MVRMVGVRFPEDGFAVLEEMIEGLLSDQGLTEEETGRVTAAFEDCRSALFKEYRRAVALPEADLDDTQDRLVREALLEGVNNALRYHEEVVTDAALMIVGLLAAIEKLRR